MSEGTFSYIRTHISRYILQHQEPIPCEQLVSTLCDLKQAYTQYGGKYFRIYPKYSDTSTPNHIYSKI